MDVFLQIISQDNRSRTCMLSLAAPRFIFVAKPTGSRSSISLLGKAPPYLSPLFTIAVPTPANCMLLLAGPGFIFPAKPTGSRSSISLLGKAPPYLSSLVNIATPTRSTHSSKYISLVIPKFQLLLLPPFLPVLCCQ